MEKCSNLEVEIEKIFRNVVIQLYGKQENDSINHLVTEKKKCMPHLCVPAVSVV